jgi:Protein of unknown function (DUF3052)
VSSVVSTGTVYGGAVTDLRTKLRISEGRRVCLMRIPDRHVPLLGVIERVDGGADVVLLYSRSREQLDRDAPAAIAALTEGGVLWVCYPKLSAKTPSDLSREVVREAMARHGRRAVSQVAIDDTWSALRFRPGS